MQKASAKVCILEKGAPSDNWKLPASSCVLLTYTKYQKHSVYSPPLPAPFVLIYLIFLLTLQGSCIPILQIKQQKARVSE